MQVSEKNTLIILYNILQQPIEKKLQKQTGGRTANNIYIVMQSTYMRCENAVKREYDYNK